MFFPHQSSHPARHSPARRHISWIAQFLLPFIVVCWTLSTDIARAATPADACRDLQQQVAAAPGGPILLPSFPTAPAGPLQHTAFLYDNAVAILALIGCGQPAAAQRLGDALVLAQAHDRYWQDGRLRNGYAAGAVGEAAIKLSGWWDNASQSWLEDRYQAGSDSGNMAWAMLALLALDRVTPLQNGYRQSAITLGGWLRQWQDSATAENPGGFRGGTFGHEPKPEITGWKSTEHNTDLAAAYLLLAKATGTADWQAQASAAEAFVVSMWRPEAGCFATGTAPDGKTRNDFVALDAQIWPLMALHSLAHHLPELQRQCWPGLRQGGGYAYSAALHGGWTEGTAQMALLLRLSGDAAGASALLSFLDAQHASTGGYYATDGDDLPTGFMLQTDPTKPRLYFHLPHLGATAWVALAQTGFNPFTGDRRLP
jgi:hypothetical protein